MGSIPEIAKIIQESEQYLTCFLQAQGKKAHFGSGSADFTTINKFDYINLNNTDYHYCAGGFQFGYTVVSINPAWSSNFVSSLHTF